MSGCKEHSQGRPPKKEAFEQNPKGDEGACHAIIWGKNIQVEKTASANTQGHGEPNELEKEQWHWCDWRRVHEGEEQGLWKGKRSGSRLLQ